MKCSSRRNCNGLLFTPMWTFVCLNEVQLPKELQRVLRARRGTYVASPQ